MPNVDLILVSRDAVERARLSKFMLPRELASRAAVSLATVMRMRRGSRISLSSAKRIARALGVSLADLVVSAEPAAEHTGRKAVGACGAEVVA